ncbi:MAG: hypothetical protein K5679_08390 [Lachnospiraceae bacterium]|nr:hypothetical protein [Lachnospiraceae bacterium]
MKLSKGSTIALSVILTLTIITGCSDGKEHMDDLGIISEISIESETAGSHKEDLYNKPIETMDKTEDCLKNTRPYGMFIKNGIIGLLIEDYEANTIVLTDGKGNVINKIRLPFRRSVYYENCEVYKEGIVLHGKNNRVCFFDISAAKLTEIEIPKDIADKIDVHNSFTYLPEKNAIAYASEEGALYMYANGQDCLLYQGDIFNSDSFIPCDVKGTYNQKKLMICGYINKTDPQTGYCYKCIGLYDFETQKLEWEKSEDERMICTPNADIFCLSSGGSLMQGEKTGNVHAMLSTGEITVKMDIVSAENIIDYIPAMESFLCVEKLDGGNVYMIDKEGNKKSIDIGYDCPDLTAVNEDGTVVAGTAIVNDDKKEDFTSVLYVMELGEGND